MESAFENLIKIFSPLSIELNCLALLTRNLAIFSAKSVDLNKDAIITFKYCVTRINFVVHRISFHFASF